MLDELQIDTSAIDELSELKRERTTLRDRLLRLESEKEKVSEVVYGRVRDDYEHRLEELEARSRPLEASLRREDTRLRSTCEALERELETKRWAREELELRHRLGELDDAEHDRQLAEVGTEISSLEGDLARADALRRRFEDAFDPETSEASEPESAGLQGDPLLTSPFPAPPDLPPAVAEGSAVAHVPPEIPPPLPRTPTPDPPPLPEPPVDLPLDGTQTEALPPDSVVVKLPEGDPPGAVDVEISQNDQLTEELARTGLLPAATLVADEPIAGETVFPIDPFTTIGRGATNQMRINERAVSRHHAQISLTEEGYVLRDLGSENGTYINGEPIREGLLTNGDRLQLGTVSFVFRLTEPQSPSTVSARSPIP